MKWVKLTPSSRSRLTVPMWHILTATNRVLCTWVELQPGEHETKQSDFTINACGVCLSKHYRRVRNALERSKDGNSAA